MKNKILISLCILLGTLTSCSDMFDTDSSAVIIDKGQRLDSPNDSLYSVMGILSQMQRLGDRYVLLGELRGDLMEATPAASVSMQALSHLDLAEATDFQDATDYYAIINNCNYALARMDTTITIYQTKVMLPEYAAIKTLRDWTYLQIALAYGEVAWTDAPILTVEDAAKPVASIGIEEAASRIISDLTPLMDIRPLDYGTIDGYASAQLFYPLPVLVADMHLLLGHYAEAARLYCAYLRDHRITLTGSYANNWVRDNRQQINMGHPQSYMGELQCGMLYSSDLRSYHPSIIRYAYNETPHIVPSAPYLSDMEHAMFFYAEAGALVIGNFFEGDLRGQAVANGGNVYTSAYGNIQLGTSKQPRITKYLLGAQLSEMASDPQNKAVRGLYSTRMLPLLRTPHIYLHLAEALNRMGKPSTAFAIMKYGLNRETMENAERINPTELEGCEDWLNFSWIQASDGNANVGTAFRGRGRGVTIDRTDFIIPATCETLSDSILCVEDYVIDELAAETAFEGNRFFDLLRVAYHRGAFPAFLADRISRRMTADEADRQRLNKADAWFLKR